MGFELAFDSFCLVLLPVHLVLPLGGVAVWWCCHVTMLPRCR